MSSGRGRKRAGNGSSGNSPSGMQQGHQVRQGSSFWTCPACGTAVHTALTSFHLSSCPVLTDSTSAPALKKKKTLPRQLTVERREHGSGQCPEFVSSSTKKRGIGQKKSPWEEEDEDEDDGGDVCEEEQLGDGSSSSPLFMEASDMCKKLSRIPGTPNPKTPIEEVGEPRVVSLVENPKGDHKAKARKRLFENWGQKLSPEREPDLGVQLFPVNTAAATPFSVDPQSQRSEVMNPSLYGGEPTVVGLVESPMRDGTAEARKRLFEDWGQKLSPEPEPVLGVQLSPVNAAAATPFSVNPQSQRTEVMNPSLYEGEPTVVGIVESPMRDETAEARKRLFEDWGQKLSPEPEPDLGVHLSPINAAAAATPFSVDPQTQRSNVLNGGEPMVVGLVQGTKRDHTAEASERLFVDERTKKNSGMLNDELSSPLPCSTTAAALLAPNTPGKALVKPAGEYEERDGFGGDESCNLYTVGNQRTEGTPGGGTKTPGKGLISELLDSFPPAQGIETHVGIDPFDDHFRETVNEGTSNVSSALKIDPIPMQEDGQTFVIDGDQGKNILDNERLNESRTSALPQAFEISQEEIGPRKKRRKPALVIDSDSEEEIGDEKTVSDVGDSTRITTDGLLSGTEVYNLDSGMGRQVSNPGADSHAVPVTKASNKDRSLGQGIPTSPPINVLFGTEGEEDAHGISAGSRNIVDKSCFSSTPDPITEILRMDRELFSPPSVNVVLSSDEEEDFCESTGGSGKKVKRKVNVVLSSDEEEDICENSGGSGKKGKRRRLVKVHESLDGTKTLQPDPNSEETKEIGTDKLRRRSERLRNVHTSVPKQTNLPSKQDGESDSDEGRSEGLGTSGQRSSSQPHVPDNDDDPIEIDSDSSDGRPSGALHKLRKVIATQKHRHSGAQTYYIGTKQDADAVDEDGDIETDESDFINDDPESDGDPRSSSSVDEISESGEASENEDSSASESLSEKHKKYNWDLEGDMLAALAKDKELCLRGLCAIYRRQEDDEKIWASSKYQNKRGFSTFHTPRASRIASFLMGDTTDGPMVKTVKELKDAYDQNAVTYCRDMCIHYSKQLFEIYQNDEDSYFPEPYTGPEM